MITDGYTISDVVMYWRDEPVVGVEVIATSGQKLNLKQSLHFRKLSYHSSPSWAGKLTREKSSWPLALTR